jgi:hypothetical protein
MPTYNISVFCADCGRDHAVLLKIHVENGPDRKQRSLGRSEASHTSTGCCHPKAERACYKTGKKFLLENEEEIFLIPPAIFKD